MSVLKDDEALSILKGIAAGEYAGFSFRLAIDHFAALIAERDALRKDAERYRWLQPLRQESVDLIARWGAGCGFEPIWLDLAIDEAIRKQEAEQANVRT